MQTGNTVVVRDTQARAVELQGLSRHRKATLVIYVVRESPGWKTPERSPWKTLRPCLRGAAACGGLPQLHATHTAGSNSFSHGSAGWQPQVQGSQGGFPLAASPHDRPSESPLPWLPCPSFFLKDTGQVGLGPTRQVSFELNHLFKALYLQTQARSEGPGFRTLAPEFRGSLFRP